MGISNEDYQRMAERVKKNRASKTHHPRQNAVVESNPGDASLGSKEVQGQAGQRFLVRVTSFRKRLLDEDNLCEKYHVDLCRYAGILPDDSPEKTRIETRQEKVSHYDEERTEIEVIGIL